MSQATGTRIVFPAAGEVAIEEFAVPAPGPGEILVRARHSLISAGTELTNLTDALGIAEYPLYPGYSHVGEVVARGYGAPEAFPVGSPVLSMGPHSSHVALEPAAKPATGEHIAGNQFALPIPAGVDIQHAPFAILGSVAMHAIRKARPELGQSAAVFGQDVVGQLIVQLARAAGCRPVIALDLDDARLALARRSGATATVNPNDKDPVERLFELTNGHVVNLLFDATRTPATLPVMLKAAAHSARVLVTGSLPGRVEIDLFHELQVREISISESSSRPRRPAPIPTTRGPKPATAPFSWTGWPPATCTSRTSSPAPHRSATPPLSTKPSGRAPPTGSASSSTGPRSFGLPSESWRASDLPHSGPTEPGAYFAADQGSLRSSPIRQRWSW